jgi:hypothetical protein
MISVGAVLAAFVFVCSAPRTSLRAETGRDSTRDGSLADRVNEPADVSRMEPAAIDNSAVWVELALLDAEMRQLAAGIKRIDKLLQPRASHDPALQAAIKRIAARSSDLLERQRRLTELNRRLSKIPHAKDFAPATKHGG